MPRSSISWWCGCVTPSWRPSLPCLPRGSRVGTGSAGAACSPCRIRVAGPQEAVLPPAPEEVKVLRRVGAAPDVRLACQLRPHGDLRVTPLLPATAQARDGFGRPGYLHGAEREIVILFGDL